MDQASVESIAPVATTSNMKNYEEERAGFSWETIEQTFSWAQTGKVNMAHEAIDRHANSERKKIKWRCITATIAATSSTPITT